ncbi:MAG: GspE/PulE family protein [Candidatus Zixiibacteriota bacterium]
MTQKRIGDLLLEKQYCTPKQLKAALQEQARTGIRIGDILLGSGTITADQLVDVVSERLDIPKVSLPQMVIDPQIIQHVPVDVARRYILIPIFQIGNTITIAMDDPLNIIAIDEIKYRTDMNVRRAIATRDEILKAIDEYYSVADSLHQIIGARADEFVETDTSESGREEAESDSPIVKLVNLIISKAVKDRASDVHIEPEESKMRIRYRINGAMREEASPPKSMQNELVSRVKIAANLDVSEKRVPQDGRFMTQVDGSTIDLRVSTLPTIHGEKIVIRILDRRNLLLTFDQLGFNKKTELAWKQVIRKPEGLVLICGPTSSGKTSTLYAALQDINSIEKNIITVEDPVEYSLPLINQIQINEKAGLTFPSALRSILRQNPDVIMIGEIRDSETAKMAVRSALTGHLVFSTIHTNDAPSAITRLIDMGIEPYLVAASLEGVVAQRLVRTNCPNCRESYRPSDSVLQRAGLVELANDIPFQHGVGCNQCKLSGFVGQCGVFEHVEISPRISDLILNRASLNQIKDEARRGGYIPLFEMGLEKVTAGKVSLEELLKQTSNVEDFSPQQAAIQPIVTDANPV